MQSQTRYLILVLAITAVGCLAYAQDAPRLQGNVYLKGGQVLSGNIKSAELGFRDGTGTGVGSDLAGNGGLAIKLADGAVVRVPASEISAIEAKWEQVPVAGRNPWQVSELKATKRDGTVVSGTPDWFMHASSVAVETEAGDIKRVHAFPLARDFSPDNLVVRIELGQVTPTPTPITPVTETTATTTVTPTPTTTTTTPTTTTSMEVTEAHVLPSQDIVVTLRCPNCGETITLLLRISALQGVATGASGVSVSPVVPAQ